MSDIEVYFVLVLCIEYFDGIGLKVCFVVVVKFNDEVIKILRFIIKYENKFDNIRS